MAARSKWQDKGLVFCDNDGGFLGPEIPVRWFGKLIK